MVIQVRQFPKKKVIYPLKLKYLKGVLETKIEMMN